MGIDSKTGCGRARYQRGFTLIELMITVAIVAILAAIAYPAYTNAVLKGHRAEGRAGLSALMQQEERSFTANGQYLAFNGAVDSSPALKAYSGDGPTSSAYKMGASPCATTPGLQQCVVVFAVPVQADSTCGTLTITSTGLVRGYGTSLTVSGAGTSTVLTGTPLTDDTHGCWR